MALSVARPHRIIHFVRPLRPPNGIGRAAAPRLFGHKTPLMLASRPSTRPQIPYLSSGLRDRLPHTRRRISTEQLDNIKYQIKLGLYWSILGWTVLAGLAVAGIVLRQDWLDKQYPAPSEWNWYIKYRWRKARLEVLTEGQGMEWVSWNDVSNQYRAVVSNLEKPRMKWNNAPDPKNVLQEDFDRSIPGVDEGLMRSEPEAHPFKFWPSRIGYDVSRQSEAWRRGYYEAMMGVCKSAEMLVGSMRYIHGPEANGNTYAPEHIRSDENPYPKPFPPGMKDMPIPDARDCTPACESPDFHYLRLLTTKGFSRKQRLDAGVAYALWLDASDRPELAEKIYQWSLDLACQGVPDLADKIVDRKTNVIKSTAPFVTDSILSVITSLASHHARHENITASLNIYLSVLRARRNAPEAPPSRQHLPPGPDFSLSNLSSIVRFITALPWPGQFPELTSTGDEPFQRTERARCDEAAIMAYVGEILFSRSGRRAEGLSWTRDATALAEKGLSDKKLDDGMHKVCTQCFTTGLDNWRKMVSQLAEEQDRREKGEAVAKSGTWLWASSSSSSGKDAELLAQADWRAEERRLRDRQADWELARLNRRLSAFISREGGMFVV